MNDKERSSAYYQAHKQELKERSRLYRLAHPELVEYHKAYYLANKEKIKANNAKNYSANAKEIKEKKRLYRNANKEKVAISKRKSKYGISAEKFMEMVRLQNNKCAICGEEMIGYNNQCVDHNHSTGIIRGLLCNPCNRALGYFKDDIEIIKNAVDYMRRTNG